MPSSFLQKVRSLAPARCDLKAVLENFGARTVDDLHRAIGRAMDLICTDDAAGRFKHFGYGAPPK